MSAIQELKCPNCGKPIDPITFSSCPCKLADKKQTKREIKKKKGLLESFLLFIKVKK